MFRLGFKQFLTNRTLFTNRLFHHNNRHFLSAILSANITNDPYLETVNHNCYAIRHIDNPNLQTCLSSVNQDGMNLQFVKKHNPLLSIVAIINNGLALQFSKEKQN